MKLATTQWVAATASSGVRRLSFVLAFAFISAAVIRTTLLLDVNKRVFDHKPGRCRSFPELADGGAAYFEDVSSLRLLFATDGFQKLTKSDYNASIFLLKYPQKSSAKSGASKQTSDSAKSKSFSRKEENLRFQKLTIHTNNDLLETFTPLGIGSQIEGSVAQGRYRLQIYVVNSPSGKSPTVEVFLFKPDQSALIHQYTVRDASFKSLSDIVVLGPGRFIVSNMFYSSYYWLQVIETLTQREYGSLLLHDGKKATRLIGGLQTPNGLVWDSKKRLLYATLTLAETVKIYHVKPDFETIEQIQLNLMSSPDQLRLGETGDLWITSHPIAHTFIRLLFGDSSVSSASQVLRVRFQDQMSSWVITEPLANNGTTINAASAITIIDDLLLIGGRVEKTLMCRINDLTYA
ncbi:hypothetical protein M3Y95_00749500 [Aphelenchoides besseyi]|nr:hypothetical protein M3Y95_00749500 [Aphelenchoides besseyi]